MHRGFGTLGRGITGLLLSVSLAVIMALLVWFTVQADDRPSVAVLDESVQATNVGPPLSAVAAESVSSTVFLPFVTINYPPPPSVFGIEMSGGVHNSKGAAEAVAAGMQWVRLPAIVWKEIEPVHKSPAEYLWNKVDEQSLSNASQNGMEVIAIVYHSPDWALQYPGHYCGPIKPSALNDFGRFLEAMVRRYSQPPYNVHYWELGNEPDVDHTVVGGSNIYGCWGDVGETYYGGEYYAEMLKVAYPAIKRADPSAQVINGGLLLGCDPNSPSACKAEHGVKPSLFLEGILSNGGGDYFDIVAFHAYANFAGRGEMTNTKWPGSTTSIPEKVEFLQSVLKKYGYGDKPLMNTEGALLCKDHWLPIGCRDTQAVYVTRAFADAMAVGLKSQVYYSIINDHWWNTGLLEKDLTPRPAYNAYVATSDFLTDAEFVGPAKGYPAAVEGYEFRSSAGHIDLIWSKDGSIKTVVLPPGATAHDLFGDLIASPGQIQVDYNPVWLITP